MGVQHFAMNPPQKHFATEIKFVNACLSKKKKKGEGIKSCTHAIIGTLHAGIWNCKHNHGKRKAF